MIILDSKRKELFDEQFTKRYGATIYDLINTLERCYKVDSWVPNALREYADFLDSSKHREL